MNPEPPVTTTRWPVSSSLGGDDWASVGIALTYTVALTWYVDDPPQHPRRELPNATGRFCGVPAVPATAGPAAAREPGPTDPRPAAVAIAPSTLSHAIEANVASMSANPATTKRAPAHGRDSSAGRRRQPSGGTAPGAVAPPPLVAAQHLCQLGVRRRQPGLHARQLPALLGRERHFVLCAHRHAFTARCPQLPIVYSLADVNGIPARTLVKT